MSQTKIPKLTIKTREGSTGPSTGLNTIVQIDGVSYPISFLKLEFKPKNVTKAYIEMYVQLDVELDEVEATVIK